MNTKWPLINLQYTDCSKPRSNPSPKSIAAQYLLSTEHSFNHYTTSLYHSHLRVFVSFVIVSK